MKIRLAREDDLGRIVEIYNYAICNTVASFDTESKSKDERLEWFREHNDRFPIIIAENGEEVVGWASLSKWSDMKAYDMTAELSLYVDCDYQGEGVGNLLMKDLIDYAKRKEELHVIISRITGENDVSLYLHQKYNFKLIGIMEEIGYKFGRYLDVHLYQFIL